MTTPESDPSKKDDWLKPTRYADRRHQYRCRSRMERGMERLLHDWYGAGGGEFEIESHQGDPVDANMIVDELMEQWSGGDRKVLRRLVGEWSRIAGAMYEKYTIPSMLENGVLSIEVFNTVILSRLRNVEAYLLSEIQNVVGTAVREIRFIPGGRSTMRPGGRS